MNRGGGRFHAGLALAASLFGCSVSGFNNVTYRGEPIPSRGHKPTSTRTEMTGRISPPSSEEETMEPVCGDDGSDTHV